MNHRVIVAGASRWHHTKRYVGIDGCAFRDRRKVYAPFVNFRTIDADIAWSDNSETNAVALDRNHSHTDVVIDNDFFAEPTRENEHGDPPWIMQLSIFYIRWRMPEL
jgi:hypothetical protein